MKQLTIIATVLKDPEFLGGSDAGLCPGGRRCSCDVETEEVPRELRERAVRLVFESKRPIAHVARDLGVHKESLRHWCGRRKLTAAGGVIC
jgi:hypothetical protein